MQFVIIGNERNPPTPPPRLLTQKIRGHSNLRYGIDSYDALTPVAPPVRLLSFRPQALLASDFELVSSHYSHDLTIFFAACCPILLL